MEGARPKTLATTSALPEVKGKTTLSANLAITLAFSGARMLVVDDMRRGKLSSLFGVTEGPDRRASCFQPWVKCVTLTTVENLSLIPRETLL